MTTPPRPEVVGHGGAGDFYPSNSRRAIETALRIGVDRIEVDVQRTSDGAIVLVHDERVKLGSRRIPVRSLSLAALHEVLDDLITLEECIALVSDKAGLLIDLKAPHYEREVTAIIGRYGLETSVIVSSTYALSLRRIRRQLPAVAIGLSSGHIASGIRLRPIRAVVSRITRVLLPSPYTTAARAIEAGYLMVHYRVCTERLVESAHEAGIRVYPWTVNSRRLIDRMLARQVDGIISNRPDLVREAIDERFGSAAEPFDDTTGAALRLTKKQ